MVNNNNNIFHNSPSSFKQSRSCILSTKELKNLLILILPRTTNHTEPAKAPAEYEMVFYHSYNVPISLQHPKEIHDITDKNSKCENNPRFPETNGWGIFEIRDRTRVSRTIV